jgi:hypothetical protein
LLLRLGDIVESPDLQSRAQEIIVLAEAEESETVHVRSRYTTDVSGDVLLDDLQAEQLRRKFRYGSSGGGTLDCLAARIASSDRKE